MPNIDNRIVQMTFDNSGFEQKAKTTMSTLEKLKASMDFSKSSESLNEYENAVSKFSLKPISNAVQDITAHFDMWEVVALRVIGNIVDRATDAGIKIAKSLSVDQVTAGWNKFNDAIAAEQTIMSAVEGKFDQNGVAYDMDGVIQRIEKLRTYSDETSYSLSQMTNAIGTFTASGVDLDVATTAIMGISNACADAGVSTQKAESAYIAFAKAIGSGNLTLSQWNMQLKTSGLTNSERFRQSLLDAAEAEGTLIRQGEKLITVTTKEEVTTANLESTLTDGKWANTNVMLKALSSYSDTVDGLLKDNKIDITGKAFDSLRDAMEKQGKTLQSLELDKEYDTVSEKIKALKNAYKDVGLEIPKSVKAFARAQEAISLSQAIDSVKEAVSSGWAKTYETIFGNYNEARQLWTDVSNDMWDWFVSSGEIRNEIFDSWKSMWTYDTEDEEAAVTQIIALWRDFAEVINAIRDTFLDNFFGSSWQTAEGYANNIKSIAEVIYNFIEKIRNGLNTITAYIRTFDEDSKLYEINEQFNWFRSVIKGTSSALSTLGKIISSIYNGLIKPIISMAAPAMQNILDIFGEIGVSLENGSGIVDKFGLPKINSLLKTITDTLKSLFDIIENITSSLLDILKSVNKGLMEKLNGEVSDDIKTFSLLDGAIAILAKALDTLKSLFEGTLPIMDKVKSIGSSVIKTLSNVFNKIVEVMTTPFGESSISPVGLGAILILFQKIFDLKWNFVDIITTGIELIKKPIYAFVDLFDTFSGALDSYAKSNFAKAFKEMATSMLIFAGAMLIISSIDENNLMKSIAAIGLITTIMSVFAELFSSNSFGGVIKNLGNAEALNMMSTAFIKIGAAILIIAGAAKLLSGVENLGVGLGAVAAILAGMVLFVEVLNKLDIKRVTKGLTSLLGLASAVVVLSLAVKILASMDTDDLIGKGLFGLAAILTELGVFMIALDKLTGKSGGAKLLVISASLTIITGALIALTGIVYALGSIDINKLKTGLTALGVLFIELGAFMGIMSMSNGLNLLAVSTSMLIISGAVLALSVSLNMLAKTNITSLVKSITVLTVSLVAIGGLAALLGIASPLIIATGAAFLVLGAGMKVIAEGMVAFAGASVLFSAAGTSIADALVAIAAGIIEIIPMIIVGFAKAIVDVAGQVIKIVGQLITIICTAIVDNFPTLISTGLLMLLTFLQGIRDNIYEVAALGIEIVLELMAAIGDQVNFITDGIVDLLIDVINGVANTIRDKSASFGAALGNLAEALIEGIIKAIFGLQLTFASKIVEFGRDVIEGIKGWFNGDSGEDSTKEIGTEAIVELANGMDSKRQTVRDASEAIGDEVVEGADRSEEASEIGNNFVDGVTNAISSMASLNKANNAGSTLMNAIFEGAESRAKIASPSKEAAKDGRYIVQGLVNGIQSKLFMATESGDSLGSSVLDAISKAMNKAYDLIEDDTNSPVITPILDLNNIRSGMNSLNGILNQNGASFAFASGALGSTRNGFASGGFGSGPITLNNTINVNNNGTPISDSTVAGWTSIMINRINEELGGRL